MWIYNAAQNCWRFVQQNTIEAWRLWRVGHPTWKQVIVKPIPGAIACLKVGAIAGGMAGAAPIIPYHPSPPIIYPAVQNGEYFAGENYGGVVLPSYAGGGFSSYFPSTGNIVDYTPQSPTALQLTTENNHAPEQNIETPIIAPITINEKPPNIETVNTPEPSSWWLVITVMICISGGKVVDRYRNRLAGRY